MGLKMYIMRLNRENNFDLIRLLAAFQVLFYHSIVHLGLKSDSQFILDLISHFPGVPIFFTISGFLISYSLERTNFDLKKYFRNRALRIYPALWICTIITAILFASFIPISSIKDFLLWFFAQISFFQFYASPLMKSWGVGHPNGSLWSIAVELQFYVLLPIILVLFKFTKNLKQTNILLVTLFLISLLIKYLILNNSFISNNEIASKLAGNTVFFNLHFFLTGIAFYKNYALLEKYLSNKIWFWLSTYLIYILIFQIYLKVYISPYDINLFGIIANTLLSFFTLSFAFSYKKLSKKLLAENDISYGLYIYHMPIINTFIALGHKGNYLFVFFVTVFTLALAALSWKLIEQKAIKLKNV